MAQVGYARVSTIEQNLDRQLDVLQDCDKIFKESISGKNTDRPELQKMLDYVRENDIVVVKSISRLARSNRDLHNICHEITKKGCQIAFLDEKIDTSTSHGKLVLGIFGSIAEFERETILERQREGIEAAKARGKHLGRPKLVKPENYEEVMKKWQAKEITATQAWQKMNISKASFYRLVKRAD